MLIFVIYGMVKNGKMYRRPHKNSYNYNRKQSNNRRVEKRVAYKKPKTMHEIRANLGKYKTLEDIYSKYPGLKIMKLQELIIAMYNLTKDQDYDCAEAIKTLMILEKDKFI